jgi:hypothetical protein
MNTLTVNNYLGSLGTAVKDRVYGGVLVVESPKHPHIFPLTRQFPESHYLSNDNSNILMFTLQTKCSPEVQLSHNERTPYQQTLLTASGAALFMAPDRPTSQPETARGTTNATA